MAQGIYRDSRVTASASTAGPPASQTARSRLTTQGGGNMPAYAKNLSPAETTALVAFLQTLHPAGQAPAREASRAIESGAAP